MTMAMCRTLLSFCAFGSLWLALADQQWETKVNEQGKKVQSLQIQAPTMTEEDQYGYTMPERYRCDSCKAVVYHLNEALTRKQPKSRRLQEWEIEEIFQETCKNGFKGYGIKLLGGNNVLSGPALKHDEKLQPGMGAIQMGGENWEKRLGELCRKFVYDKIGEDEIYEHFHAHRGLSQDLCFKESRDCKVEGPADPQTTKAGKSVESEKTKKQSKKDKKANVNKKLVSIEDDSLEFGAFVADIAGKHGRPSSDFTGTHGRKHWKDLLLQAAAWVSEPSAGGNAQATEV